MATKYAWKENGPRPSLDADVFGGAIERMESSLGRPVTPTDIVEEASKPRSPIRPAFNWDDIKAAHQYRLQQASDFMRGLMLVKVRMLDGRSGPARAFYSISIPEGRGYVNSGRIFTSDDLTIQIFESAKSDLLSFVTRYRGILVRGAVITFLDEAIERIEEEIARLHTASVAARTPPPKKPRGRPSASAPPPSGSTV